MTTTSITDVVAAEARNVLQVYRRGQVVFERGSGTRLFTQDGRSYIDLISGVGVAALGHAHAGLAAAIGAQAKELLHTSNLFFHPLQAEVAARLSALTGLGPRVFLQQRDRSGGSVPEVRTSLLACGRERRAAHFVALEHAFHGRTMGSLSVTWDDHYRTPFKPLIGRRDVRPRR